MILEDGTEVKPCTKCKLFKPLSDFLWREATTDNLTSSCRECLNEYNKQRRREKTPPHQRRKKGFTLEDRRDTVRRRRAMRKRVACEVFTELEIYERDGWVCQICGLPIDPTLKNPDPMSKSIDHFWQIKNGGPHIRANVRAAHLTCNKHRSLKTPEVILRFIW